MRKPIVRLEVKRVGKKVVLNGIGQTARGTKFIVRQVPLPHPRTSKQEFRDALALAVPEILKKEDD